MGDRDVLQDTTGWVQATAPEARFKLHRQSPSAVRSEQRAVGSLQDYDGSRATQAVQNCSSSDFPNPVPPAERISPTETGSSSGSHTNFSTTSIKAIAQLSWRNCIS